MSGTKTTRQREALIARLLEQCERADSFRFEVPNAPSITIHLEANGIGGWSITRFGWQQPMTLGADGWVPQLEVARVKQYRWTVSEALERAPGLLEAERLAHAAWQQQHERARRAGDFAAVVDELLEPIREAVAAC